MARRWIRLNVDWDEDEWIAPLDGPIAALWPRLLCKVKRDGVRGRCKRPAPGVIARRWGVPVEAVLALEAAAMTPDSEGNVALVIEGGEWIVTRWPEEQEPDPTAAERKRRQREKEKESRPSRVTSRDKRESRRSRDSSSRATETPTATPTDETDTGAGAPADRGRPSRKVEREQKQAAETAWIGRACSVWTKHMGGEAPGGRIAKALRPLVKKYGEAEVLKAWDDFLAAHVAAGTGQYANVNDFAARYGYFKEHGVKMPAANGNGGRKRTTDPQHYGEGTQPGAVRWVD
jgi:hypothetical protein